MGRPSRRPDAFRRQTSGQPHPPPVPSAMAQPVSFDPAGIAGAAASPRAQSAEPGTFARGMAPAPGPAGTRAVHRKPGPAGTRAVYMTSCRGRATAPLAEPAGRCQYRFRRLRRSYRTQNHLSGLGNHVPLVRESPLRRRSICPQRISVCRSDFPLGGRHAKLSVMSWAATGRSHLPYPDT